VKTSSCKAKGRKLQQWVAQKISDLIGYPWGKDELIASREMSQSGTDIRLIGDALKAFPFSVETKAQESWSVHQWVEQAKSNQIAGTDWILFAKRNRSNPIVIMDAETFFKIYKELIKCQ